MTASTGMTAETDVYVSPEVRKGDHRLDPGEWRAGRNGIAPARAVAGHVRKVAFATAEKIHVGWPLLRLAP